MPNPLPVLIVPQQMLNWCWAASGQMIMNYLGNLAVTKCKEATEYPYPPQSGSGIDWCAAPPNNSGFTGWPQFDRYGFQATQTPTGVHITWDQLKAEIDGNRPVAFVWAWTGGGGHMMVAVGYETVGGVNKVIINDPSPPDTGNPRSIPFTDFVAGNYLGEDYTHWCDFYGIVMTHPTPPLTGGVGSAPGSDASNSRNEAEAYLKSTLLPSLGPGATHDNTSMPPGFAVKAIGLNQLQQLAAPGGSAVSAIDNAPVRNFQYPVINTGAVVAAISTSQASPGASWVAGAGNASWVRIFNEVRTNHFVAKNIPVESYFLVAFNALNLYFLGYKQEGEMYLIPTQDNATLKFVRGVAQPAKAVLDVVTQLAIAHTGGPS